MRVLVHNPGDFKIFAQRVQLQFELAEVSSEALLAAAEKLGGNDQLGVILVEDGALVLLRNLRKLGFNGPIVVLKKTRVAAEVVELLYSGADDVMILPVTPEELAARFAIVARRMCGVSADKITLGAMEFYLDGRHPSFFGKEFKLSAREYDILRHLVMHANRVVSKEAIYDVLYALSPMPPFDKIIDVYICRLRGKMNKIQPASGHYIKTVPGRGYRFGDPDPGEISAKSA